MISLGTIFFSINWPSGNHTVYGIDAPEYTRAYYFQTKKLPKQSKEGLRSPDQILNLNFQQFPRGDTLGPPLPQCFFPMLYAQVQ